MIMGGDFQVPTPEYEQVGLRPEVAKFFEGTIPTDNVSPEQMKILEDIYAKSRRTEAYENRTQATKTAGGRSGQIPSESHMKARLIQKGMTEGWDKLTPEEKTILDLNEKKPTVSNLAAWVKAIEPVIFDYFGDVKPDADPELVKTYQQIIKQTTMSLPGMMNGETPNATQEPGDTGVYIDDPLGIL